MKASDADEDARRRPPGPHQQRLQQPAQQQFLRRHAEQDQPAAEREQPAVGHGMRPAASPHRRRPMPLASTKRQRGEAGGEGERGRQRRARPERRPLPGREQPDHRQRDDREADAEAGAGLEGEIGRRRAGEQLDQRRLERA